MHLTKVLTAGKVEECACSPIRQPGGEGGGDYGYFKKKTYPDISKKTQTYPHISKKNKKNLPEYQHKKRSIPEGILSPTNFLENDFYALLLY